MADSEQVAVRSQPLIAVADVLASSAWYQRVLGATSGHGGDEYERLVVDGVLVLQLHGRAVDHHHGPIAAPGDRVGNGVLLWFEIAGFEAAVERVRAAGAAIERDVHVNPNSGHRELWFFDPDGYRVVFAEPDRQA